MTSAHHVPDSPGTLALVAAAGPQPAAAAKAPAYVENVVARVGPGFPTLSPGLTAYASYILASLRSVHPELGINRVLTGTGRKYIKLAETECVVDFEKKLEGVGLGGFFTGSLGALPKFSSTIGHYMAMPERGFDKPFFMGHGLKDVDVPYSLTAPYVEELKANDQPLTFKSYDSDHSGTLIASQKDTHPFVRELFAGRRDRGR